MSKYGNKKAVAEFNGQLVTFDSTLERDRFNLLLIRQKAGEISGLELQPEFILLEKFTNNRGKYRGIKYIADFRYLENDRVFVEDAKGVLTKEYQIKKQLFLSQRDRDVFGQDLIFREVTRKGCSWNVKEM